MVMHVTIFDNRRRSIEMPDNWRSLSSYIFVVFQKVTIISKQQWYVNNNSIWTTKIIIWSFNLQKISFISRPLHFDAFQDWKGRFTWNSGNIVKHNCRAMSSFLRSQFSRYWGCLNKSVSINIVSDNRGESRQHINSMFSQEYTQMWITRSSFDNSVVLE